MKTITLFLLCSLMSAVLDGPTATALGIIATLVLILFGVTRHNEEVKNRFNQDNRL